MIGPRLVALASFLSLVGPLSLFALVSEWEQNPLDHGQSVTVSVDFSLALGPVKALNGINEGPGAGSEREAEMRDFAALNIASVRLHDIPLTNPGVKLVDVQDIFPIWNPAADPKDERNYFFDQTDDYIQTLVDCGVKEIFYRLGTSIEWTKPRQHFAKYPQDPERYAEVCAAIVRHYTRGWARGFKWGEAVKFKWEFWNEPNLRGACFDRDFDAYLDFYARMGRRIRAEFPEAQFGGPSLTGMDFGYIRAFVDCCRTNSLPLDFFTIHAYLRTPEGGKWTIGRTDELRRLLDASGFKAAPIYLTEWNYFPCTWTDLATSGGRRRWRDGAADGMNGIDAAAFITLCLTRWQDQPLDGAHFYMFRNPGWGVYSPFGEKYPTYDALRLFGEFLGQGITRVAASGAGNFSVLAGVTAAGARRILISDFKPGDSLDEVSRELTLKGAPAAGKARVQVLDAGADAARSVEVEFSGGKFVLPAKAISGSAVYLVEF